jgi:hypothetical protein
MSPLSIRSLWTALRFLSLVGLAFTAACPCSPSSPGGKSARGVSLQAAVNDPLGAKLVDVYADLSETRGDPYPRSLVVALNDPVIGTPSPLAGHILHVRLLDGSLQTIQEIKVFAGNSSTNSILTETVMFGATESARYDAVRSVFLSGKTTLEVETDLPGEERLRVLLRVYRSTDWTRNSCD